MLLRRLCISIVLRGRWFLQLIGKIIPLLLRHIPLTRRRRLLLLLLRAAHSMHEHEYRSLLHICGHDERSARKCRNRACRLDEIELRTVADTMRTRSTGSGKAQNGGRCLHTRQQVTCVADHRSECLLLCTVHRTKR